MRVKSGREANTEGQGQEWSECHHGGSGVVESPSQKIESGREALPYGWESPGGPPRGARVVGRPTQSDGKTSQSGREAITEGRESFP